MAQTFRYWLLSFLRQRGELDIATFATFQNFKEKYKAKIFLIFSREEGLLVEQLRGQGIVVYHDELEAPYKSGCVAMSRCMPYIYDYLGVEKPEALSLSEEAYCPVTKREHDVLELLAQGQTLKEVAYSMGISKNTVVSHQRSLYLKTGCRNVIQLVLYAIQQTKNLPV
ncbi:MAG: helix-turn-helix transcriptional regulator [Sphaerochaetaceae bacterium]